MASKAYRASMSRVSEVKKRTPLKMYLEKEHF